MSSSILSWQILTAHAQPFRRARDLAFCLKVPLDSLLVWASSGVSGETARMRRLAWTFVARTGDKYQIRLTRSIWRLRYIFLCNPLALALILLRTILTHLVYIANGKKSCSILQQFTERKCVMLLGAVLWHHPSHGPCLLALDGGMSVLQVINVRNACKCLCYSQTFGGISSLQWWKVWRICRIQLLFNSFLCVRIEINQL